MNAVLTKAIFGQKISKEDIYAALFEICDTVHACCDHDCPVYDINDGPVDYGARGCVCFKNGKAMYEFIVKQK